MNGSSEGGMGLSGVRMDQRRDGIVPGENGGRRDGFVPGVNGSKAGWDCPGCKWIEGGMGLSRV